MVVISATRDYRSNEKTESFFALDSFQVRMSRKGTPYLTLNLLDHQKKVIGFIWRRPRETAESLSEGSVVKVRGEWKQLSRVTILAVDNVETVGSAVVDMEVANGSINEWRHRLISALEPIKAPPLVELVRAFLRDESFMEKFCDAPGGTSIHHNYRGGLLEHTVNTLELAYHIGSQYGKLLNMDILLVGCFLHDIGKIREMFSDVRKGYTEEGKLIGHIFIGVDILDKKMNELDGFSEDIRMVLKHMILSHHATPDFSSHRKPATPEAILLNLIESMDAKINRVFSVLKESGPNGWTRYDKYLRTEICQKDFLGV